MRSLAAAVALVVALPLYAVAPQFWSLDTPEDFLAGEIEGLVVTARGSLRAGPAMTRVATVDDPFVLSQAIGDDGTRFIGTGNAGKVYRLAGSDLKLLYTAPEPEIYAMAFSRGALYVATSPNGKIYRVDPRSGAATEHFDPKEAFIWALSVLPDGGLAAATGIEGRLYRIDSTGKGKVWYDAPETHLRSIAVASSGKMRGKLLVGGSGEGRIYEVSDQGGRALYDSALSEISAIYFDSRTGEAWAAGVTNVLPTSAPARTEPKATTSTGTQQQDSNEKEQQQQQQESTTAEVSFSFGDVTATPSAPTGSAELYRISADGYVDPVRKFDRELIYAITGAADGTLFIATGPQGRVYQYAGGEFALIAAVPEKQLISFGPDGSGSAIYATTTNSGAVYRITPSTGGKGEFRSAVKDTLRFSSFGQFRSLGSNLSKGATVSFRSGNTNTPDETWSAWSAPVPAESGKVNAPAARYLQLKINGAGEASVDSVSVAFVNRNVAPQIDSVSVADPAVVYLAGNYPVSPQVVEATNPDEYGIFTSLDEATDRNTPGKRYYRRGYRTVSWKASDPNGDLLRYSVYFRRAGSETWLRLRENVDETQLNFDTSQLPDGRYEIRVTVSDLRSNPNGALTDAREGIEMLVDNTAPKITSAVEGDQISIRVNDALSPIGKVEYSVDAQKWVPLIADDGISDAPEESFRIARSAVSGKFVVVRAVDVFYNVATASAQ